MSEYQRRISTANGHSKLRLGGQLLLGRNRFEAHLRVDARGDRNELRVVSITNNGLDVILQPEQSLTGGGIAAGERGPGAHSVRPSLTAQRAAQPPKDILKSGFFHPRSLTALRAAEPHENVQTPGRRSREKDPSNSALSWPGAQLQRPSR